MTLTAEASEVKLPHPLSWDSFYQPMSPPAEALYLKQAIGRVTTISSPSFPGGSKEFLAGKSPAEFLQNLKQHYPQEYWAKLRQWSA